ncbi:hypothetical protein HU200_014057 [Digitaria exilis]|uniref:Pectinesterase inhibitor domain-containing protein n=1 Tax=Digitaria exilis TaxID=1010633 RepID=A0A835FD52_9POAL|nr:hypothetical protein HU200_014057 [Digitaria exilis]
MDLHRRRSPRVYTCFLMATRPVVLSILFLAGEVDHAADPAAAAKSTTPRGLAEAAIRAASTAGAAAGDAREDIEEALSHLDDSEGDDAKLREVNKFLDTAEQDAWDCDDSCKGAPNNTVKATLLAKNKDFEALMAVALSLIKRVTAGDAPAPSSSSPP